MSQQAEDILQMIVERAVEAENIPVPAIWRSRIVDLCVRVVHKLITADAAVVLIARESVKAEPARWKPDDRELARCNSCGRKTWDPAQAGQICGMTQPGGVNCKGSMVRTE